MSKSIFLYVHGEDYSAVDFERNYNKVQVYNEMISEGTTKKIIEDEDNYMVIEIKEFNEVDDNFVSFIKNNICDYDMLKNSNIYRITL